ncbi:uncharacterized protein K02A2.6-like [Daktulosphaira vitifoliae]|uniref:uncharacterized protein K02A2.6-like n=1 Tax=Daktulosphaira vitifoliae TaxID=58002 RepID=UPI0021AAA84A|nr:uncharacterized protein K02A2.6-like [Daktulosphaira vitifoliae]
MSDHLLWRYHDHVSAGHPGWKETYRSIGNRFFWTGMRESVRQYVARCHVCACVKPLNRKQDDPMRPRQPRQPWEVVSIDLMGPYPRSQRGKTCLLVATDCYSRWVEAYPLGQATAKTITDTLEREFFSRFGYARVLLSDNGTQFVSKTMEKALEKWGTEGWTTPIYHPRANPVERRNQDLKKGLRTALVDKPHSHWDSCIPNILFSIRNRRNRLTGSTPSERAFGREAKAPGDWLLDIISTGKNPKQIEMTGQKNIVTVKTPDNNNNSGVITENSDVFDRKTKISGGGEQPSQKFGLSSDKKDIGHKLSRENHRRRFKEGDWVYYRAHPLSSADKKFHAGFAPKWLGPVQLAKRLGEGVFVTKGKCQLKLHVTAMKYDASEGNPNKFSILQHVQQPKTGRGAPFHSALSPALGRNRKSHAAAGPQVDAASGGTAGGRI